MREIKFRAWVKNSAVKEMIYPEDTQINSSISKAFQFRLSYEDVYNEEEKIEQWQREIVFMQFTGLKDKNGKEIYEGDIILFAKNIKNIVIFKNGMFCYDSFRGTEIENLVPLSNYHFEYTENIAKKIEVIGNIYENPDLTQSSE